MKIFNTLTRKAETFKPLAGDNVSLYTCGPTVYNYYHIGNLRNAVFNDTLRRTLEAGGFNVKHVMNITDVGHLVGDADDGEDKLETGAKREGKTVWEIAEHYTQAFKSDMQAMNVLPPNGYESQKHQDSYARATEFIDQQIDMVHKLLDKGYAYQAKQAIYFDVKKHDSYGVLTGQKLSDKEVGTRDNVVTDPEKRNPHDFAVWFFAVDRFENHSMQWDSPWGKGFPGWHLECSAIIHETLGDPIDIHTGGVDHIGTHHPNEMAQTEAAFGHDLAKIWVHNEFILVDGVKMSKSKGNSYLLKNIIDKGFDPLALRLLYLQAHYRTELNFSWENLEAAQNRLKTYEQMADMLFQPFAATPTLQQRNYCDEFQNAFFDDLNTAQALAILSKLHDEIMSNSIHVDEKEEFLLLLTVIDELFGLQLAMRSDINPTQKQLIIDRGVARTKNDWAKSDAIRDLLVQQGLGLNDTQHGQIWFRI